MKNNLRKIIGNALNKTLIEFDSSFHDYMKRFDSVEELIDDFSKYVWQKAKSYEIRINDVKEYLKEKWTKPDEFEDSIAEFYEKQICTNCGCIMPGYILFVCRACRKTGTLQPYEERDE